MPKKAFPIAGLKVKSEMFWEVNSIILMKPGMNASIIYKFLKVSTMLVLSQDTYINCLALLF